MDRTGRAPGQVDPVLYLENSSGHLMLLPVESGHDSSLARRIWIERYKSKGYDWREAGTLSEVARLEKRLVEQERREAEQIRDQRMAHYDAQKSKVRSDLRQRMYSADPWEREFIQLWLQLDDDKRKIYEQRWKERNAYLWALHENSGTKVEDRMRAENSL